MSIFPAIETKIGKTLFCSHCHNERPLTDFTKQLTKLWNGNDLKRVPKSCDKMLAINAKHNSVNNAVNNTKRSLAYYEAMILTARDSDKPALRTKIAEVAERLKAAKQRLLDHQLHALIA